MDLFYALPEDIHGGTIVLRGEEAKHISRVLRKGTGDRILVTNGEDVTFEAVIVSLGREDCTCEIVEVLDRRNEPSVEVTLGLSLLRNQSRFEFAVEKATEFGVRSVIPLVCERTIVANHRLERTQKIALAATKQTQRSYIPRIFPVTSLETLLTNAEQYDLRLIPHEKIEQSQFVGGVLQHHQEKRSILVVIGPEGGFTEQELEVASFHSFIPISLGARRLRSETAAISAVNWIIKGR